MERVVGWFKSKIESKTSPNPDDVDGWKVTVRRIDRFSYRIEGIGTGRNRKLFYYDNDYAWFPWTADIKAERMLARLKRKDGYRSEGYILR